MYIHIHHRRENECPSQFGPVPLLSSKPASVPHQQAGKSVCFLLLCQPSGQREPFHAFILPTKWNELVHHTGRIRIGESVLIIQGTKAVGNASPESDPGDHIQLQFMENVRKFRISFSESESMHFTQFNIQGHDHGVQGGLCCVVPASCFLF